ncbi:DNA (cytosine-5)-methyltransferase 1 [Luteibacter sp. UNC138MFCol5.1]|uniref:DNA cytosine methyltransferase n=1 Tax=Luteibacter sp. UNC138MFCol5.1 TaxID=1502774 RepID=UPI0008BFF812|nr:DNA cytosine methyltransferase [Luteibacter sp. UNC138MFCol5.1]SEO77026.1 DNA (cytosine-5)-methyltransferase 1 [Luteibacter sp. UNC138MFCol5.1]
MADGNRQTGFNFPSRATPSRLRPGEIVVDFFAGGGGASEALRQALGRDPDVAVNHDPDAIAMHAANHPFTRHMEADVWAVDILREVAGRLVGWFHASPDCTHFSQAKGGQPRSKATRSLSWVVLKVAGTLARAGLAPRIVSLENVEQILKWGPLVAKRDKATGRVVKLDGTVAARGERVSVWEQCLVPDKKHAGRTWEHFVGALRSLGYVVEWRKLVASDYGAGTSRKRLFLVARRDGQPIVWPEPTHGPGRANPYVTAADCIDFAVPCPSIFERKKPLADATMRRIARGVDRYVLKAAEPFIVGVGGRRGQTAESSVHEPGATTTAKYDAALVQPTLAPLITQHAQASVDTNKPVTRPIGTMCAEVKGGHFALIAPTLVQTGYGERAGQAPRSLDIEKPIGVAPAGGVKHAVAAAHLVKFRGDSTGTAAGAPMPTITSGAGAARPAGAAHAMGVSTAYLVRQFGKSIGADANDPVGAITAGGSGKTSLASAHLAKLRGTSSAADVADALHTISAGGEHHAVVECTLSPEHEAGALRVAAFLIKYYGTARGVDIDEPLDTVTTKDRLALVTVWVQGNLYVIVDIGLRMLRREELFRAQGFPADYIIDRTADGRPLSISKSVRMVGNSVSPPPLRAIAEANLDAAYEDMAVAA